MDRMSSVSGETPVVLTCWLTCGNAGNTKRCASSRRCSCPSESWENGSACFRWTGRSWIVVLSKAAGETPVGEVNRARKAAELAELRAHPAVAAVLEAFPGAEISEIRPLLDAAKKDVASG